MPSYNAGRTIEASIQSVIDQSFDDWELVVVDDGSSDDSIERVLRLRAQDPRIQLFATPSNTGPAGARNLGIKHAKGRYIAFLDSDDLWLPDKLTQQLQALRAEGAAFCCTGYRLMRGDIITAEQVIPPAHVSYQRMLRGSVIGCLTVVFDTTVFGKPTFDDGRSWLHKTIYGRWVSRLGHEDYALWLRMLRSLPESDHHRAFIGLPETLAIYRIQAGSFSASKKKAALFQWIIYRQLERLALLPSLYYFSHYALRGTLKHRTLKTATASTEAGQ